MDDGVRSLIFRGTKEKPGLVLGIVPAAESSVTGIAFQASKELFNTIDARELSDTPPCYERQLLPVQLQSGEAIEAIVYVADQNNQNTFCDLSLDDQAAIICSSSGEKGPNLDYFQQTLRMLHSQGVPTTADLDQLDQAIREFRKGGAAGPGKSSAL